MSTLERLRRADPVPEPDRLLAAPDAMDAFVLAVMERSGIVSERLDKSVKLEEQVERDTGRPTSILLLFAAAAAVTVLVGGALLALARFTADPEPAAPTPEDEVASVNSAYQALNAGDIAGWLGHFSDDADVFGTTTEAIGNLYEVLAAANYRTQIVEECRYVDGAVACMITETNDFFAAGGLSLTKTETFVVDENGKIVEASAKVVEFTAPGQYVFTQAFYDWLRDAYPEVHAEIRPMITTHLPQQPEQMRAALEYLDEFIAQSDRYPVGTGS